MRSLPKAQDPNLLVGFETSDDAGVYRLSEDTALVVTADFITPPVDDPYVFGQIAAANALSDVYAMGGRPITCLNLAGFPSERLEQEVLGQIIAGALSKITEAGAVLAGGHTTEDEEPKFGLSVTGLVHPERFWANAGARLGDRLILTKAIGSGVVFNANLKAQISPEAMSRCLESVTTLNRRAAEVLAGFDVHAATDITGFGLAGHALEMAEGAEGALRIDFGSLPLLPEAAEAYQRGGTTGVNGTNRKVIEGKARFDRFFASWEEGLLVDPQTSGGLMVAVPEDQADGLVLELKKEGSPEACVVGTVEPLEGGKRLIFG